VQNDAEPGAVFGPVLTNENRGSVIRGLSHGRPPGLPRLAFWIVDVRDLADVHIRAMTSSQAAGQRFIATGEMLWMGDVATTLRDGLGHRGAKVATRRLPDGVVRLLALFGPPLRAFTAALGRRNGVTSAKAMRLLNFAPRPAATTSSPARRVCLARRISRRKRRAADPKTRPLRASHPRSSQSHPS
jgi:nucleoside-diphosphate-sugar epimerase